jgi:hypothetical protein
MAQSAPARLKINTGVTQPAPGGVSRRLTNRGKTGRPAKTTARVSGETRQSVRRSARVVVEVGWGVAVYPPAAEGDPWRAVWTEDGRRRYCQGASEERLAAKLARVTDRLEAGAPNMERPGADLIAWYLSPARLPAQRQWSRKHAHTQRRLCERFAVPVIGTITCQDIRVAHMQRIVNAAPTPGEGDRVQGMISALVNAGIDGGYPDHPAGKVTRTPDQRQKSEFSTLAAMYKNTVQPTVRRTASGDHYAAGDVRNS